MKAIIYAAKSTEDEHGSLPTQLEECRRLAEGEGWEVVGDYQDEAASAYKGDRGPGLASALDHVKRIKGALIVQHTDRLARGDAVKARHLIEIYLWAVKAGVRLRSVQDDSTCENIVMAAVMGERNTEDSRRKSAATKAGKRRAWGRGDFPGGPTPDGFEKVDDEVRIDPDRIDTIRLIGEFADQGWGDPSIARELNRRGLRTKGGGAWTRRRIQNLLTNAIYYGGIAWRRGTEDEEVNWDTDFPAPWIREDFERRARARAGRDKAAGSERSPAGRPHTNHALAGLAICGRCVWERGAIEVMRPLTSTYRRKDGSRRRTYVCRHVHGSTGLCDMPPVDAEVVDTGIINGLGGYVGDFEAWREQLLSGYANERDRLAREVADARDDVVAQEKVCAKRDRLPDLASNEGEMREALRLVREANAELERRRDRLGAAEIALDAVPDDVPADAMLDFYNELGDAIRGRLEGANTLARVNDALRDIFAYFMVEHGTPKPGTPPTDAIIVTPMLRGDGEVVIQGAPGGFIADPRENLRTPFATTDAPPLRGLHVPSQELANTHE